MIENTPTPPAHFLELSQRYLIQEFVPRIRGCIEMLSADDVWWRPNEASNSVGNLLLHLEGNLRQWIVSGVGGAEDVRTREREFAERQPIPATDLVEALEAAVDDAVDVLERIPQATLLDMVMIQGREVSVMDAVYHAVEHFSMHTGQILFITKMRLGRDLGFYRMDEGIPRKQWRG